MGIGVVLGAVNAELGGRWQVERRLAGGWNEGARARGLAFAALGVEDNNPRARRLYERLGYQAAGRQPASWETEDDDGVLRLYETTLTILRKRL